MINSRLIDHTARLKEQGLHRKRLSVYDDWLNFSSNDYLSLSLDSRISNAFQKGFADYPSGSGGSMVVCGYHGIHKELEQAFAKALKVDDALLFSSGYAANLAIITLLSQFETHLLLDKALHASFYDGLRLTNVRYTRYLHNNLQNLALKLQKRPSNPVVITESVFSMSGQMTNLHEMTTLCATHSADCLVDEAHAFGVWGREGLGAVVHYGLSQRHIPLRIIPLGKAFAAQGAVVAGSEEWIDALLQSARSFIYSTAISPAFTYGLLETLTIIRKSDDKRRKLHQLIDYFQKACSHSPLKWVCSQTPVQQLQLGCPHKALHYAEVLRSKGIFCQAIREPTVTKKHTGLRIIINYHHNSDQIDYLFSQLHQIYESTY
ncbi:aminotransferase class I/II-fold pyridoxal phosphate-dependent enzyme [Legionella fairfieldensis]|uniref:aminotransferase class I/II-fold pyridoxal phosphate-dependent enzyme n=1 Tax=Legionella fairfieldensis TaxID=45064 RepID=UPI00055E60F9|nr:aminotransferase class I/II-fold pyridoxal phosphate-dependent enzyme [Legionella fairfieldensis]